MAGMEDLAVPLNLAESTAGATGDGQRRWLAGLPAVVADLVGRWGLQLGAPFQPGGHTAWVAPALDEAGNDLVLKVGWRHAEAEHEVEGLHEWDGDGAVRLYASAQLDDTIALLIERCRPGTPLAARPEHEQDLVVAALLTRLWREPASPSRFRSLREMCDQWADEFERRAASPGPPLDGGLARDGIALFRDLPTTAARNVLLCTDLHADNVLAAEREPWLMIDPKPYVGDPTYDALQHMLNGDERLHRDPFALTARMAALLDLDRDRLLLWLFARCVQESAEWPALRSVARRIAP
jgi:streptomycin 6-kinase